MRGVTNLTDLKLRTVVERRSIRRSPIFLRLPYPPSLGLSGTAADVAAERYRQWCERAALLLPQVRPPPSGPLGIGLTVQEHHARRNLGAGAGAKRAWCNDAEHPLTLAYVKGQLIRGNEIYTAKQRYDAGEDYRQLFESMHRSGRDSTDLNLVSSGSGLSISQFMVDAVRKIACIESRLKAQDRAIIRHVC